MYERDPELLRRYMHFVNTDTCMVLIRYTYRPGRRLLFCCLSYGKYKFFKVFLVFLVHSKIGQREDCPSYQIVEDK